MGNLEPMDLTKEYPRSPRERLNDMTILARAIDKARAHSPARWAITSISAAASISNFSIRSA